ncbi:MAG: hypothetical protein PHT95_05050 [Candidatus Omnitrophica bacterium]|jgi:hypothetical protein|nr:hypothetical protein [Candidatus Omnitrophota bacterium]MDD4013226.1 hypothetical protein [Candidatus Omnitrophota bacterium]
MGLKDRKSNEFKKRLKRRQKREKLAAKGMDLGKLYNGRFYIGHAHLIKEQ